MAANKPNTPTKVTNVVHSLLEGLHSMSKSETVVGDAYTLGDATLVPVHRLRVALGAGAVSAGAKQDASRGESGGQGAGGVVQIEPIAVIAVGRDGVPRILTVETENDAVQKLVERLPDMLEGATKVLSERVAPIVSKLLKGTATPEPVSTSATAAAPAQLPLKTAE